MKLFTKDIDKKLFAQYSKGSDLQNQMVVAKIFNPYGRGTWYIINSDPSDPDYLWAIVDLFEVEVGSVSRTDLETIKVPPFRLNLERDIYFTPVNAQKLYRDLIIKAEDELTGESEGERRAGMDEFKDGGQIDIAAQNKDMLLNYAEELEHHTEEFEEAAKKAKNVEPWVVAKIERATTDLSDVTHYLDSENEKRREYENGEGEEKEYEEGGEIVGVDLFEDYENIPPKVQKILERYSDAFEGGDYRELEKANAALKKIGYTFEYGLDGEPYDLRKIGEKGKSESYEKGGELKWQNAYAGDSALVVSENKMGLILKSYGRKFHLKFPDGTEKTYDANDLKFFGDNDDYEKGGEMGVDKHRIYFSTLGEVIDAIYDIAAENGYEVVDIFPDLNYGGISYGQTKKVKVDLKWNGKEKVGKSKKRETNTLNVSIYRMDSGNYELVSYFAYKYGGKMRRGGEISVKVGDKVKTKSGIDGEVYEVSGILFKLQDKYGNKGSKYYSTREFKPSEIKSMADGGMMAKGGMIAIEKKGEKKVATIIHNGNVFFIEYYIDNPEIKHIKGDDVNTYFAVSDNKYSYGKTTNEYKAVTKKLVNAIKNNEVVYYEEGGMMASGSKVKFADKVKSIKSSLLKRKKVSPSVQKDYGKTYSPKEAEESAKRIVGAMTAKERLMKKRKK